MSRMRPGLKSTAVKQMKGEQRVLQKLLDTEITMLRAMRDGSAVMQHMEDFYYITLLQVQQRFPDPTSESNKLASEHVHRLP